MSVRVNISIRACDLRKIDHYCRQHSIKRSAFIREAAIARIVDADGGTYVGDGVCLGSSACQSGTKESTHE